MHAHAHMHRCIDAYMNTCICACLRAYMNAHLHTCRVTHIMFKHMHAHTHKHTCICMCTHMPFVQPATRTHIHTEYAPGRFTPPCSATAARHNPTTKAHPSTTRTHTHTTLKHRPPQRNTYFHTLSQTDSINLSLGRFRNAAGRGADAGGGHGWGVNGLPIFAFPRCVCA